MKIPNKVLITALGVAAMSAMLWHGRANADVLGHYQPPALLKAEWALERGNPDRALALLDSRKAELRRWRAEADASALACRAWYDKGDFERAEQACDQAVQQGGGAAAWSHLNNRGVMRLLLGRTDEAIADFHEAASRNPSARPVHRNLAIAARS